MFRLSSKITLVAKIIFPVAWIFFFGLFWIASMITQTNDIFDDQIFLICFSIFYFGFIFLFYRSLFKLMRIDGDETYLFISNYKRTYRYTHDSFETMRDFRFGPINLITLSLKSEGKLGKDVHFLADKSNLGQYIESYPNKIKNWEIISS